MMAVILRRVLRLVVGGAFIAAGSMKIAAPAAFVISIDNFRLLPHAGLHPLAITLPWIEVLAGLLLVAGFWKRPSALVCVCLMTVFTGAVVQAMARGLNIDCGCYGTVGAQRVGWMKLAENLCLLTAAVWLAWHYRFEDQKT